MCTNLHADNQSKPSEDFIPLETFCDDSVIIVDDLKSACTKTEKSPDASAPDDHKTCIVIDDSLCNESPPNCIGESSTSNTNNNVDAPQNCSVIEILEDSTLNNDPILRNTKKKGKRKRKCKDTSGGSPLKKKNTPEDVILIDDASDDGESTPKKSPQAKKVFPKKKRRRKKFVIPLENFASRPGNSPMFFNGMNNLNSFANGAGASCSINRVYGDNLINGGVVQKTGLRTVIIDGSNVAMGHSNGKFFSVKGLQICINYFLKRGHKVKALVPHFRTKSGQCSDPKLLNALCNQGHVILTPSREINGKQIVSYDDRFIVQSAAELDGVIVSSDNYRDLIKENPELAQVIERRLLMPTWLDDLLIFPPDPLGKYGPNLETFLRFP